MRVDPVLAAPLAPTATGDRAALEKAAKEFEAVAIAELLRPVFEELETDGIGGGGAGERMFRPMLVNEYANKIAEAGGVGLADGILRELIAMQAKTEP